MKWDVLALVLSAWPWTNAQKWGILSAFLIIRAAAGLLAVTATSVFAVAEELPSVTVQASRMVNSKTAGKTANGIPIVDVSMSYGVSRVGLLQMNG
jgi:hypothetical protein